MVEFIVEMTPFFILGILLGLLWHTRSTVEELTWAKEGHDVSLKMLRERIERLEGKLPPGELSKEQMDEALALMQRQRHREYVEARKRRRHLGEAQRLDGMGEEL